jgi:hypothetical protein
MRRRFEGRQQAARVGGKGRARGTDVMDMSGAMARGNRHQHYKHLLRCLRDLELYTTHTPHALQFGILPNPQYRHVGNI